MKEHKIPARSELDPQFTWATTDLYPSDEAWEAEIPKVKAMIDQFKAFQGKLGESARSLLNYMKLEDTFNLLAEPFACYAFYKQDEDTRSPAGQKMNGQVSNLLVQIGEATAFAVPEILEISDADMDRFYQEAPELEHYRLALTRIRRQKAHTLSKEQEALRV